jgi:hypothetical protein
MSRDWEEEVIEYKGFEASVTEVAGSYCFTKSENCKRSTEYITTQSDLQLYSLCLDFLTSDNSYRKMRGKQLHYFVHFLDPSSE